MITKYLDLLDVSSKSFSLLIITPKGEYPLKSYGHEFDNYVKQVLSKNNLYIGIFENERPEILQDVAFRLFTMPLIGDKYNMVTRETIKEKRATKQQMEAFIVAKEYYATVPTGQKNEEEAIERGREKAESFIKTYANGNFEVVIKNVSRHDEGVQFLYQMEFDRENKEYIFDYCYCN